MVKRSADHPDPPRHGGGLRPEFVGDQIVFRELTPGRAMISPAIRSLDEVYCRHILRPAARGHPDTSSEPVAIAMPITRAVPIGKHMSVPIRMQDGSVYGMFCCLGFKPDRSLHERDMQMMRVFAELAAFEIGREIEIAKLGKEKEDRIRTVIEKNQIAMVYQPIWDLNEQRPVGFECLARFTGGPSRSPDKWFMEAAEIGLGTPWSWPPSGSRNLRSAFPDHVYLSANASPRPSSGEFANTLVGMPAERIVPESPSTRMSTTTKACRALRAAAQPWRAACGSTMPASGFQPANILQLRPDVIKLDG
jgi:hypothetical protein